MLGGRKESSNESFDFSIALKPGGALYWSENMEGELNGLGLGFIRGVQGSEGGRGVGDGDVVVRTNMNISNSAYVGKSYDVIQINNDIHNKNNSNNNHNNNVDNYRRGGGEGEKENDRTSNFESVQKKVKDNLKENEREYSDSMISPTSVSLSSYSSSVYQDSNILKVERHQYETEEMRCVNRMYRPDVFNYSLSSILFSYLLSLLHHILATSSSSTPSFLPSFLYFLPSFLSLFLFYLFLHAFLSPFPYFLFSFLPFFLHAFLSPFPDFLPSFLPPFLF